MARTDLTVNVVNRSAITAVPAETTADIVNGNQYANGPTTWVTVRNAHASASKNLTVTVPTTVDGIAGTVTKVYAIPQSATQSYDVGPFPADKYGSTVLLNGETTDIKLTVRRLKA